MEGIIALAIVFLIRICLYKAKHPGWWNVLFFVLYGGCFVGLGAPGEAASGLAILATIASHIIAKKRKVKWEDKKRKEAEEKMRQIEIQEKQKREQEEEKKRAEEERKAEIRERLQKKAEEEKKRKETEEEALRTSEQLQMQHIHDIYTSRYKVCVRCGEPLAQPTCEKCQFNHANNTFFMLNSIHQFRK